jgi:hypothetical protein
MMTLKNDNTVTNNSPVASYISVPVPDSDIARRNVNGIINQIVDYENYEDYDKLADSNELSAWHNNNYPTLLNNRTLTIIFFNATSVRSGRVSFWANHNGKKEILQVWDTTTVVSRLYEDKLTVGGLTLLTDLTGWHFWQFSRFGISLRVYKDGIIVPNITLQMNKTTIVVNLSRELYNLNTDYDTGITSVPMRE